MKQVQILSVWRQVDKTIKTPHKDPQLYIQTFFISTHSNNGDLVPRLASDLRETRL